MDTTQQPDARQPQLNVLGRLAARVAEYGHNATNNLHDSFSNMSLQSWIRLTVIVGGYLLLRPYVMKWSSKSAVERMEEDDAKARSKSANVEVTPNELRGIKEQIYAAEDQGDGTSTDWGQKARLRQRQVLKDLLEEEERRRAAEHEDADIQQYLED
ncbi:hypothetical protein CDD81_3608 [Ophiocordyceps australis]|uniref:Uncharacterized protein n=1 Tax=Ophiocordyceps australis TaxID=1399860 RepID=A0A2C5YDM0_9HYPO|nr:hypothetical protein CDD81_3608 [Ophiocordyceps australis]